MKLPGLGAEASLYKTKVRYRIATAYSGYGQSSPVLPARLCTDCFCDVYDFDPPGTCAKLCFDKPGDLEYPVPCRPNECNPPCDQKTCGPCTQTCTYPSGTSFTQAC
jgi:hypothetical protein